MRLTLATFNLRNLALPNFPVYADLMYNEEEYEEKINWTAQQLQRMNADIISFQECFHGNALLEAIRRSNCYEDFHFVMPFDNEDLPRVALLSRYPITEHQGIQELPSNCTLPDITNFRRPIIQSKIQITSKQDITFFAVHLKSRQPLFWEHENKEDPHNYLQALARSLHLRSTEAIAIQHLVHQCIEKEGSTPIFIAGDLNDTSQAVTTQLLCGSFPPYNSEYAIQQKFWKRRLHCLADEVSKKSFFVDNYTHIFSGHYECLDHILASEHIHSKNPNATGKLIYLRYFTDHLIDNSQKGIYLPKHASDHGQVVATIELFI